MGPSDSGLWTASMVTDAMLNFSVVLIIARHLRNRV